MPPVPAQWPASFRPSEHHSSHRFAAQFVREIAAEDLEWKVAFRLSAERAPGSNPVVRYGAYWGRDVLTALLAADGEVAPPSLRKVEHEGQYGEQRTKLQL